MAEEVAAGHPSPRVAARQADARRRILAAARVVVSEQGFAAAQVAVVAVTARPVGVPVSIPSERRATGFAVPQGWRSYG